MSSGRPEPDMSAAAIEGRLQDLSQASPLTFEPLSRVSMAPEAVEVRLRECAEMSAVCWEMMAGAGAADPGLATGR